MPTKLKLVKDALLKKNGPNLAVIGFIAKKKIYPPSPTPQKESCITAFIMVSSKSVDHSICI